MTDQQPPIPGDPTPGQPTAPPVTGSAPPPGYPPQPSYPPPQYGYRPPEPPAKTKAIWAMVLAIIPCGITWIVAFVLALIALTRPRDGQDHGKKFAVAALVIIPVWIVGGIVLAIATGAFEDVDRDSDGSVNSSGSVRVTDVRVGDCVDDDLIGENLLRVKVVPCDEAHMYEAYANFKLESGDFPGDAQASSLSESGCAQRFEDYIGIAYDDSTLDVVFLHPIKASWRIDRGVTCYVADDKTNRSTGSLKGAKR